MACELLPMIPRLPACVRSLRAAPCIGSLRNVPGTSRVKHLRRLPGSRAWFDLNTAPVFLVGSTRSSSHVKSLCHAYCGSRKGIEAYEATWDLRVTPLAMIYIGLCSADAAWRRSSQPAATQQWPRPACGKLRVRPARDAMRCVQWTCPRGSTCWAARAQAYTIRHRA